MMYYLTNFPHTEEKCAWPSKAPPLPLQLPWQLPAPPPQRLPRTLTHVCARVQSMTGQVAGAPALLKGQEMRVQSFQTVLEAPT